MRLIILSNRLQVTVTEDKGKLIFEPSAGGLATGIRSWLAGVSDMEYLWMGWPGAGPYSDREDLRTLLLDKYHSIPVFVEEKKMDLFYHGFCNKALWPLFHYFPALTVFDEKMWEIYREVNAVFADALLRILRPDDVLWVHDYHFLLVPELIKKAMPDISVGFFLHIPFPEYEIFRLLPRKWGKEILSGMLGADLVGFHTYDYMHYFLRCVLRVMGLDHDMGVIDLGHKYTRAGAFPMGIDFDTYALASKLSAVKKEHSLLEKEVRDLKVILSVDRQDYTKGILNRLEGYESFLEKNPVWRGNVVLVMIVVPSRVDVEQYQREKYVINQTVGNINGTYGNIHWTPVIYQYRAIQFEQLAALYNRSDVALVTPRRDGMNLVAKEFVAAQTEKRGVLILSEMAGAALELGEAVIINPHNR